MDNEKENGIIGDDGLSVLGKTYRKVTHEVGNLLNNINLVTTALKNEPISPKGKRILGILENEATRVRDFVQDFLQFSAQPELNIAKSRIELIIQQVTAICKEEADEKEIHIELDSPADLPEIQIDANQMHCVINNLVKNSLEAMTSGVIYIKVEKEEASFLITIRDNGPGIETDVLDKIFNPYFTTKGKQGTGLGLSIVKSIVDAHQGRIECHSVPGKGTTFLIRIPG